MSGNLWTDSDCDHGEIFDEEDFSDQRIDEVDIGVIGEGW